MDDRAGLMGAAFMAIDELLSRDRLATWITNGPPEYIRAANTGSLPRGQHRH